MEYPDILIPIGLDQIAEEGKTFKKPSKPSFNIEEPTPPKASSGCLHPLAMGAIFICGTMLILGALPSLVLQEGDMANAFFPLLIIVLVSIAIVKSHMYPILYIIIKKVEYVLISKLMKNIQVMVN